MNFKYLPVFGAVLGMLLAPHVAAQDSPACDDIVWSSAVTDQYPEIDKACNAVMEKNGELYARVSIEILRVRNNVLTFRVLNRDGSSGGSFTQNVGTNWRAKIADREVRARDLMRGQRLNIYLPPDRWAVIHEDDDGPDMADAVTITAAPVLPATATQWPLAGAIGAGLLLLGGAFSLARRRASALRVRH
jgi:LPXTG-motif cell wall-anchored protein